MRDPARIPRMLDLLRQVWERSPDLRLGQIVSSATMAGGWGQNDPFYCEDDVTEKGLRKMAAPEKGQSR